MFRPDLIDLLFLRSFSASFQWVGRDKKIKGKTGKNCIKMQHFKINSIFKRLFLVSRIVPDLKKYIYIYTGGSQKQQIN